MPTNSDTLLSPGAAAERLGVDKRTLDFWRGRGRGPRFIRLSEHKIRYAIGDLDAFVESGRTDPAASTVQAHAVGNR